jgi:hypothetical protein
MPKTDAIDLSAAEAVCGTCGTPIFVVEGDEDWDGEGPNPGLVWAHAEEVRCDDPDARFLLDDEPAEPELEPAVRVVEPGAPRRRRPPAALLLAAMLGLGGVNGGVNAGGPEYAPLLGAAVHQRHRGPGGGPARELPEADKARQAAAEAKRARRAAKAREDAERSARGRGGRGGEGA